MTHEFSLVATGPDPDDGAFESRLRGVGCADATVSRLGNVVILDLSREATTFRAAVEGAVADVRSAGMRVVRVEPDHLVDIGDVAHRVGLSRHAVLNLAAEARPKGFPPPVSRVTTSDPLWDWAEVAEWLREDGRVDEGTVERARSTRDVNDRLLAEVRA